MKRNRGVSIAFVALGVVLIAVGISGPHALLVTGSMFVVVGLAFLARGRKGGQNDGRA